MAPYFTTDVRVPSLHARAPARAAARNTWVQMVSRFGFVVRGVVYLIPGILGLKLALGKSGGRIVTPLQSIEMIGREPSGRTLLVIVAAGLASYALWGVIRASFDPFGERRFPQSILRRLGYLASALGHGALCFATIRLLIGSSSGSPSANDWSARLLAKPFGSWLLALIGLGWIAGAGIAQIVAGARGQFEKQLRLEALSRREREFAGILGRFAIVARGVVFVVIGISIVAAAWYADPARQKGFGGALQEILRQPFGHFLLGVTALGLIAFGLFSILCARWMRLQAPGPNSPIPSIP
jgi:uncharacterized protein DUF1206